MQAAFEILVAIKIAVGFLHHDVAFEQQPLQHFANIEGGKAGLARADRDVFQIEEDGHGGVGFLVSGRHGGKLSGICRRAQRKGLPGGRPLCSLASMKVLETERLGLRWFSPGDAPFFLELMNDPAFIRNVADRGLRTVEDAERYMSEKVFPSYEQFGFGMNVVALKTDGRLIGSCGLFKRETMEHVDIGYAFLPAYCGQGFAYEAAAAVMRHGREVLKIPKIVGITSSLNEGSRRLLEKLGLRFERMIEMPGYEGESKLFA